MATLTEIREGLAANLATISGVHVVPYALSRITPPTIQILGPSAAEYHRAMGDGAENWTITVRALIAQTTDQGAQMLLDELVSSTGDRSVKAALETDPTLGGLEVDAMVVSFNGVGEYVRDGGQTIYSGAEWTVRVIQNGG